MLTVTTDRLLLAELPLDVVERRLSSDDFQVLLPLPGGPLSVHFPADWPGDPLGFFPVLLASGARATGQFILIRRDDHEAIGLMGDKGGPDAQGDLEIGYGLNPEARGQGYATEALRGLLPSWRALPGVHRVTAQTATGNQASAGVLKKCGFVQVGESWDEEDGPLLVWATRPV